MMRRFTLSDNELAVMRALWRSDGALSRPEILQQLSGNKWNPNSIHFVMNNLIKKNFIQVSGVTRCGQSYGRVYSPTMTQSEYAAGLALEAIPDAPEAESVLNVVSALLKVQEVDEKTIETVEAMLETRRKELQQARE